MHKQRLIRNQHFTQRTILNRRLHEALEVLNMPLQQISGFVFNRLEQNPFLEIEEDEEDDDMDISSETEDLLGSEPEADIDREDPTVDIEWETAFEDRVSMSEVANSSRSDVDELQPDLPHEASLHEYLEEQLRLAVPDILTSETELAIAEQILGSLNDDGQLQLILFQLPAEFLPEFEQRTLSPQLHIYIRNALQTTTGNHDLQFSEMATIVPKRGCPSDSDDIDMSGPRAWKIEDAENRKTYTVVYEEASIRPEKVLNFYDLTLEDIAETVACDPETVEAVLRKIQDNFEPSGIAHRDVREALLIQIRNYTLEPARAETGDGKPQAPTGEILEILRLARDMIENHYHAFLHQKWLHLAEALQTDRATLEGVVKWIGKLAPHPGRYFTDPATRLVKRNGIKDIIMPDVEVQYVNGRYQVISVDSYLPRLRINPYYLNLMRDHKDTLDDKTKEWITKRYREAVDFLSSLAQRGTTIAAVTEAIFEVQTEFLRQGVKGIKPMTLKTIAAKIGVHESTVSRVTSTKYVKTPHGVYPLRFFFSNEIPTTHGDAVSAKQVKNLIQDLIGAEPPAKPLSDQAVSNALKARGIVVARRTVQKYRDELEIPTSRERAAAHASVS